MNPLKPKKKLTEEMVYEMNKEAVGFMSGTYEIPVDVNSFRRYLGSMGILLTVCPHCGSVEIVRLKTNKAEEFIIAIWHRSRFKPKLLRFKCEYCDKEFEVREIDA